MNGKKKNQAVFFCVKRTERTLFPWTHRSVLLERSLFMTHCTQTFFFFPPPNEIRLHSLLGDVSASECAHVQIEPDLVAMCTNKEHTSLLFPLSRPWVVDGINLFFCPPTRTYSGILGHLEKEAKRFPFLLSLSFFFTDPPTSFLLPNKGGA